MTLLRVVSWLEIAVSILLAVFGMSLYLDLLDAPAGVDQHGYLAMGAVAIVCLALVLALAGAVLRLSSNWRWLGHIPLAALIVAMYVLN